MQKEAILGWMIVFVMLCSLIVITYYISSHGSLSRPAVPSIFPVISAQISKILTNPRWWCDVW